MLIDWITARLDFRKFTPEEWSELRMHNDRVLRFCPRTGEQRWESAAWDSIRSDSHQLSFRIGSDALWVQGSPARIIGDGDAVFGSGASAALDVRGCVERMAQFAFEQFGLTPRAHVTDWQVSRIDVTGNLLLGSLEEVRTALRVLRDVEGGRYRVSQQAGDTVYWSHRSRIRKGKAYAKGPHLAAMQKQKNYTGRTYTPAEMAQANRLLRMELTIGAQSLREERLGKPWHELTNGDLFEAWEEYFGRMVGDVEITNDATLKERVMAAAPTEGQGKAAYGCWAMIKAEGWERAREMFAERTWYRNLKILRAAGLGDADFSAGRVVEFRRRVLDAKLVESWDELRRVA